MAKKKDKELSQLKSELDNLMNTFEGGFLNTDNGNGNKSDNDTLGDIIEPISNDALQDIDLSKMDNNLKRDANSLVDSLYKLYFSAGIIKKSELLQKKKQLDTMNLSNMFFQISTIKMSLMAAMRIIQQGDPHPRLLEAFSDLQVKFSDVTKNVANYIIFLENNYKIQKEEFDMLGLQTTNMLGQKPEIAAIVEKSVEPENFNDLTEMSDTSDESEIYVVEESEPEVSEDTKLIPNSKALIDEIHNNNEFDLAEPMKKTPLTNPQNKENLASKYGIDLSKIEEDSDYGKLNDII